MLTIRLDVESLSRLQFALTIMFHYLFPPLTIGLSVIMVIIEGLALKTGDRVYENMARFWTKIFALNFVMGVITGVVMEFQFGTNWATYSRFVGDVFGSALAAEGIFAFFLESGFLAVLVFGWDRVSPRFHFLATVLVSLGGMFSAVWIVVANSWQQTPAGFHIVGQGAQARAEITDFWAMVFNPSSADRLIHTLLGSFVLGAFFVMSISAYYILKDRHLEFARRSFRIALFCAFFSSMLIIVSGHHQAQVTAQTQPAKLAAFEGHFRQTSGPAPIYVFGIPDSKNETVRFGIPLPGLLSFLVHGSFNRPVTALDEIPPSDRPPVAVPFFAYHLMVGCGMFFIALSTYAMFLHWRGVLFEKRWLLWVFVFAVCAPYLANQAGWIAAEVGRQPWVVYGLLRTSEAVSKTVGVWEVAFSIALFSLVYVLLFGIWVYVLDNKIKHGPQEEV